MPYASRYWDGVSWRGDVRWWDGIGWRRRTSPYGKAMAAVVRRGPTASHLLLPLGIVLAMTCFRGGVLVYEALTGAPDVRAAVLAVLGSAAGALIFLPIALAIGRRAQRRWGAPWGPPVSGPPPVTA
jgi:hypothetical protein